MEIKLRKICKEDSKKLYTNMKRDFPVGEKPPYFAVKRNLENNVYDAFFLEDNEDVGYAVVTAPPESEYALINFLAIFPEFRGKGYGGGFLGAIVRCYPGRVLILEVEDPQEVPDEQRETALSRINFYERNGFRLLENVRARIFGVCMLIMTSSSYDPDDIKGIMHSLYMPALVSNKRLRFIEIIN